MDIGIGTADITPDHPVYLTGYASRTQKSQGVTAPILVQSLLIEQSPGGKKVLILTYDLLGLDKQGSLSIKSAITRDFALQPDEILLASSHTHYAPSAMHFFWAGDNPGYLAFVIERTLDAVRQSTRSFIPVSLWYGQGETNLGINRRARNARGNQIEINPNPEGIIDPKVQVLGFKRVDNDTWAAVIFRLSCHPVTIPADDNTIHGDWPAETRTILENSLQAGVKFFFLQGTAGNVNPRRIGNKVLRQKATFQDVSKEGEEIADLIIKILNEKMERKGEEAVSIRTILDTIPMRLQDLPSKDRLEKTQRKSKNKYEREWAKIQLDKIANGIQIPTTVPLTVQVVEFGANFRIIALGGEVCVEVGNLINATIGGENLLVAYANDVVSYIPSSQIVKEDMQYHGYEGEQSNIYYNLPSRYSEQIDDDIARGIQKIIKKMS